MTSPEPRSPDPDDRIQVDLARVARLAGGPPPIDRTALDHLSSLGLLARDGEHLRVTDAGAILLDAILPRLVREPVSA